jgi:hypothetical protein
MNVSVRRAISHGACMWRYRPMPVVRWIGRLSLVLAVVAEGAFSDPARSTELPVKTDHAAETARPAGRLCTDLNGKTLSLALGQRPICVGLQRRRGQGSQAVAAGSEAAAVEPGYPNRRCEERINRKLRRHMPKSSQRSLQRDQTAKRRFPALIVTRDGPSKGISRSVCLAMSK